MTNANRLFKLSAIATSIALSALGTPVNPTPSGPIIILLPPQKPKDTGLRPKSPDRQEVYCTYTDGNAIIDFVFPEGMCELQLLCGLSRVCRSDRHHRVRQYLHRQLVISTAKWQYSNANTEYCRTADSNSTTI